MQAAPDATDDEDPRQPHWVLRDRYGVAIDALVAPTPRGFAIGVPGLLTAPVEDTTPRFGKVAYPCVRIEYLGNDHLNFEYELASGRPEPCARSEFASLSQMSVFTDPRCAGEAYAQCCMDPFLSNGTFYYVEGPPLREDVEPTYSWDWDGTCQETSVPKDLHHFRSVPDWVINALPDPPYTLTLEYR